MHVVQNYKLVADCRSRAINETTPVSQIIQEEIEKYIFFFLIFLIVLKVDKIF